MNRTNEARKDLDHCVELDGNNAVFLAARGKVLIELGDWDAAMADFNEATVKDPHYFGGFKFRAGCLKSRGQWQEAYDDYTRAVELEPNDPELRFERAAVCAQLGLEEEYNRDMAKYDELTR